MRITDQPATAKAVVALPVPGDAAMEKMVEPSEKGRHVSLVAIRATVGTIPATSGGSRSFGVPFRSEVMT